uniref:Putative secreted protein n=1 Tax=Ixodes ricinus TaxID=34613 RepID=A0A6B0U359_IXORI
MRRKRLGFIFSVSPSSMCTIIYKVHIDFSATLSHQHQQAGSSAVNRDYKESENPRFGVQRATATGSTRVFLR